MIFGLNGFTLFHVVISLLAIGSGLIVVGGLLSNAKLEVLTFVFLATTILTSATGLLFPFNGLLPSHKVAILSLAVLALAAFAYYAQRLNGVWRAVYVVAATLALYLNVFVLVVQTFLKNPALAALAPTQSELPFVATQGLALLAFLVIGYFALSRFHSAPR